jgi:hypothetical protein
MAFSLRKCIGGSLMTAALLAASQQAQALIPYSQGFETDTTGWTVQNGTGSGGTLGTITQVPSGGGTLGVASSSGGFHAELTLASKAYDGFYGSQGFTRFGGNQSTYVGDFYQALDIYVDLATWQPPASPNPSVAAFILDTSPMDTSGNTEFAAEHNFNLYIPTAGTVNVQADNTGVFATITESGWHRFIQTYEAQQGPTVVSHFYVIDLDDSELLGSATLGSTMLSANLGGNAYGFWTTAYQEGFANNLIAIDNIQTGLLPVPGIPEPASMALLAAGSMLMLRRRRA